MEATGPVPVVEGPMSKLFSTGALVRRAEDLAAGTGEIQRNTIAPRRSRLPRS
jgi:hypothetical protein